MKGRLAVALLVAFLFGYTAALPSATAQGGVVLLSADNEPEEGDVLTYRNGIPHWTMLGNVPIWPIRRKGGRP